MFTLREDQILITIQKKKISQFNLSLLSVVLKSLCFPQDFLMMCNTSKGEESYMLKSSVGVVKTNCPVKKKKKCTQKCN